MWIIGHNSKIFNEAQFISQAEVWSRVESNYAGDITQAYQSAVHSWAVGSQERRKEDVGDQRSENGKAVERSEIPLRDRERKKSEIRATEVGKTIGGGQSAEGS